MQRTLPSKQSKNREKESAEGFTCKHRGVVNVCLYLLVLFHIWMFISNILEHGPVYYYYLFKFFKVFIFQYSLKYLEVILLGNRLIHTP